jgi:hypothetical protein
VQSSIKVNPKTHIKQGATYSDVDLSKACQLVEDIKESRTFEATNDRWTNEHCVELCVRWNAIWEPKGVKLCVLYDSTFAIEWVGT